VKKKVLFKKIKIFHSNKMQFFNLILEARTGIYSELKLYSDEIRKYA